jgi:hypothetical protein
MMTSEKLIAHFTTIRRAGSQFKYFLWNRGQESGVFAANTEKFRKAEALIKEALTLLDEIYTPEIGKMIIEETKQKHQIW